MSEVGRAFADRYSIDSAIAGGDSLQLYRGTNLLLERPVIIKFTDDPERAAELLAEAKRVSHVSSANVLSVSDFGRDDDVGAFAVYEDFAGETLAQLQSRQPQFPVDDALNIAKGVAAGSSAAGIYGGVIPENVLIGDDASASVKLVNFSSSSSPYAAPEAVESGVADERSDVYSLGMLTWQTLAGELPSSEKTVDVPPPPLASFRNDLPSGLETVLLKAMSKDPEMRQQTLAEFSSDLSANAVSAAAAAKSSNSNIWKTAFVVLVGITLLAAALIYATSVKQTNPTTQLQIDANGQPVQPINPATGIQEQNLANIQGLPSFDANSNANIAIPPGTLPGGDGYDPWRNGGMPPPGAPRIGPGGQTVTIDPSTGSPFMPADTGNCVMQPSGILLCPVPLTNANSAVKKPTPTPRNPANANVQASPTPQASPASQPSPGANKAVPKPTPQRGPANTSAKPSKPGDMND